MKYLALAWELVFVLALVVIFWMTVHVMRDEAYIHITNTDAR